MEPDLLFDFPLEDAPNPTIDFELSASDLDSTLGSFDINNPFLDMNLEMIDVVSPLLHTPFAPLPFEDVEPCDDSTISLADDSNQDNKQTNDNVSELKQLLMTKPNVTGYQESSSQSGPDYSVENTFDEKESAIKSSRNLFDKPIAKFTDESSKGQTRESRTMLSSSNQKKLKSSRDKPLKFPPCFVCGGKASGLHYGVNSCEACKGFFRRYIIRNEEYKCMKDWKCVVVNKNRENCSGCRLRKCLELGMSKENSKLGRYTLSRRTETIRKVNELKENESAYKRKEDEKMQNGHTTSAPDHTYSGQQRAKSGKVTLQKQGFPYTLVKNLATAMLEIKPYGPSIQTEEQLKNVINYHHERYKTKVTMYGQMKSVPKEEYYKLLKEYGIDIDGRLKGLKQYVQEVQRVTDRVCSFAKKIPGFQKLSCRDQSSLLKASRCGFFIVLMNECYDDNCKVVVSRTGKAFHVDEVSDKCFSRKLIQTICAMYVRWQKLRLTKEEKALIMAITLVFTDQCKLEEPSKVEEIQLSLIALLQEHLKIDGGVRSSRRFVKIIDCLTTMRESSEVYRKEYQQLCNDETVVENVPQLTEFLVEDW